MFTPWRCGAVARAWRARASGTVRALGAHRRLAAAALLSRAQARGWRERRTSAQDRQGRHRPIQDLQFLRHEQSACP